ncbi:MAG: HEAT repeat domain-containing protein, partial [bacterium]|nr:HEAT repeat domain-containing protein [bacterium]
MVVPLMAAGQPTKIRTAAIGALADPQNAWTVNILLEAVKDSTASKDRPRIGRAAAETLAKIEDARAIPTLIGLIDADNSAGTIYGVGHFGLTPLTGVDHQDFHHGPWWRKWWTKNKSRFPKEVQDLPI